MKFTQESIDKDREGVDRALSEFHSSSSTANGNSSPRDSSVEPQTPKKPGRMAGDKLVEGQQAAQKNQVNFDFGAYDPSVHGDGHGFGQKDLDYIKERGASDENIKNYMSDYQASGGRVGSRAAKWAGMEHSEGASIKGHDASQGPGAWWHSREGGSAPQVNYDYSTHDSEAHGGTGIGKVDIEAMRRGGASNENIKNYIRDYSRQGGIVGGVAASFAGVKENMTAPGEGFHPGSNLGEWWTNRKKPAPADWGDDVSPDRYTPKEDSHTANGNSYLNSGNPQHTKTDTTASEHVLNTVKANQSGLNEKGGKAWANKWSTGYDARSARKAGDIVNQFTTMGIENAKKAVSVPSLAKTIDQRPLYHSARANIAEAEWMGDKWHKDYNVSPFVWPESLAPIEKPDLDTSDIRKDMKKASKI